MTQDPVYPKKPPVLFGHGFEEFQEGAHLELLENYVIYDGPGSAPRVACAKGQVVLLRSRFLSYLRPNDDYLTDMINVTYRVTSSCTYGLQLSAARPTEVTDLFKVVPQEILLTIYDGINPVNRLDEVPSMMRQVASPVVTRRDLEDFKQEKS